MPKKYHIDTMPTPHRRRIPGRASLIDWEEGCLKCAVCVKTACVYGVYKNRKIDDFTMTDNADMLCKHCFQCVQNCPNRLISKSLNPEFEMMGNEYWTPAIIASLNYQAETGKIPVSGAGYAGPFSGPGFDSMWTDMSEIVRPTRDGIHGREYISTSVDIGRKPPFLGFTPEGGLSKAYGGFFDLPLPIVMAEPAGRVASLSMRRGLAEAASRLGALYLTASENIPALGDWAASLAPVYASAAEAEAGLGQFKALCLDYAEGIEGWLAEKADGTKTVIMVRLPHSEEAIGLLEGLTRSGAGVILLSADAQGRADFAGQSLHQVDLIPKAHLKLIELGLRDEVTLMTAGGIAQAEHLAKAMLLGVDALVVDQALWVAMECRVCDTCREEDGCPVQILEADSLWVRKRVMNLIGAWHSQLLEMMGAMGMREARRLRGEMGRAMVFAQLERESFAPIFGQRKDA